MKKYRSASRNTGIDLLRGISILAVLLLHLNLQIPFNQTALGAMLPRPWYNLFFWSGFYGVAMFFVISGYLITISALKKWGSLPQVSTWDFYRYRFARIMPLLGALLLVLAVLHFFQVPRFVLDPDKVGLARAVFAALTFHFNWLEIQVGYLPGNWDILWSLSIEETFYLTFPLLCLLMRKEWQFVALVAIFFVISPWARVAMYPDNELGDRNHLAYIDAIAVGCITALVAGRVQISERWLRVAMIAGWGLLVLIFFFRRMVFRLGFTANGLYISILALGVGLVLLWMHHRHARGEQGRKRSLRWLTHLGQYSYEIYLTHMFVVFAGVAIFRYLGLAGAWVYALYLLVTLVSYALGAAVARYFSDPVNRWLRKRWIERSDVDQSPAIVKELKA